MHCNGRIIGRGGLRPAAADKLGGDPADPSRGGSCLGLSGL